MKEILQTKMFKQQISVLCLMHVHLHPFHVDPVAKNIQVIYVEGAEPEADVPGRIAARGTVRG